MPRDFGGPPGGAWELNCNSAKTTAGRPRAGSRHNNTGQVNAPTAMAMARIVTHK
jgi:hypothetical protein